MSSPDRRRARWALAGVLLLGVLWRLPWLADDWRVTNDLGLQRTWVRAIQAAGVVELYDGRERLYPPLMSLILATIARAEQALPAWMRADDRALNVLIKLPAVLADEVTALLLALALRARPRAAIATAALYLFHPAVWYVSAFWAQVDSVYIALLVLALLALCRDRFTAAWLVAAAAVGIKLQAVAFLPVLLPMTLVRRGIRGAAAGVLLSGAAGLLLASPWWSSGRLDAQFWDSVLLTSRAQRIVVSGYNFWYLIYGDAAHTASSLAVTPFFGMTTGSVGFLLFGASALLLGVGLMTRPSRELTLATAVSCYALFLFPPEVHERFLLAVIPFLLLATATSVIQASRSRRMLVPAFVIVSLTLMFNLATIAQPYYFVAPFNLVAQSTASESMRALAVVARVVALINLLVFAGLMWLWWQGDERTVAPVQRTCAFTWRGAAPHSGIHA